MAWGDLTLLDGYDAIVYIQAAGVTAAPGTADELGWITDVSLNNTQNTTEKGPHINRNIIAQRRAGKSHEVTLSCDMASGTQAAKGAITTAFGNNTDVKITIQVNPTTGDKWVYDDCVVTAYNVAGSPADGWTCEFTFSSTDYTFTADAS